MLNSKSGFLVVLVATYNRLDMVRRIVDAIETQTRCHHETIVIDGGSTDGTIEYLKSRSDITPVFQGKLAGTARAYNQVWRQIESNYTCWLSDDTEVVNRSLDVAVGTLESHPEIGMVGLKMKDTMGPWVNEPYMGGLSEYGILNCNHGVIRTGLLKSIGYFNEGYRSYTIDPDLTASVLSAGKHVVMTRAIGVLHHREWAVKEGDEKPEREMDGIDNKKIYLEKFKFLRGSAGLAYRVRRMLAFHAGWILFLGSKPDSVRLGLNRRDRHNLTHGRFIRVTDPLENIGRPYHLVQRIPRKLARVETNCYRHLLSPGDAGSLR